MMEQTKTHKFKFLVLEKRPQGSTHPQGDRVLECIEFSRQGMKLKGSPRFESFPATLSMPQNGERVEASVEVVSKSDYSFQVKFISPSEKLVSLLSWWDSETRPSPQPSHDRDLGIDA